MSWRNLADFYAFAFITGGVSVFVKNSVKVCSEAFPAGGKAMQGAT